MSAVPIPAYDLSTVINKTPAGGIINVPAGVFLVRCDGTVVLKERVTIRGASREATVIQRDPAYPVNNQPVLLGRGDRIVVQDLTLDANSPESPISDYAYACLHIYGKAPYVSNVRGIRPSGNFAKAEGECWAFWMVTGETIPSGIVSDCTVSDVRGDYVEAFSASGACTFRNCRADFPVLDNASRPFYNGFQGAGRSMFLNCIQTGGTGFFYTDTESCAPIFRGCLGLSLVRGVWVVVKDGQTSDGLTIDGCEFQLTPNLAGDRYGVAVSGEGAIRNVRVVNSVFRYAPGNVAETMGRKFYVAVTGGQTTLIAGNAFDPDFALPPDDGAYVISNTPIARAPIAPDPIPPVEPARK